MNKEYLFKVTMFLPLFFREITFLVVLFSENVLFEIIISCDEFCMLRICCNIERKKSNNCENYMEIKINLK